MNRIVLPKKIRKRDNSLADFDRDKIEDAIFRAALEALHNRINAQKISGQITKQVLRKISGLYGNKIPHIESVQDIIETVLMSEGYGRIARTYILYRERHSEIRLAKSALGLKDDLKLPVNTMEVLKIRYLLKDDSHNVIETPSELFRRVAGFIAGAEDNFNSRFRSRDTEEIFYHMMRSLEFMPNSPTLMNAGTDLGQLSACFVLPVEDSIDGIFAALKSMAKIHQTGGGTGFSFSRIRPKGDLVASTKSEASGPVSFMSIFDRATDVIVQGGRRRGANMGILHCSHPDVMEFIEAKAEPGVFSNFNLSLGVTDKFMRAVKENKDFELVNPRTGMVVNKVKARLIFNLAVDTAWRTGDPGFIFLDKISQDNPTPGIGKIEATNPCGELPLLPYESCNLASINLSKMVRNNSIDWKKLKGYIHWGVRFLDDVIEVNRFPLPQIREITSANRKIGLGVMGFADMLIKLKIPYVSQKAVITADKLMRFIRRESLAASIDLAGERGVFPNFKKSIYAKKHIRLRNATVNTIAPTGTISIIAGCSSGIEPLFAISFVRNVLSGTKFFEINPMFEETARKREIYSRELMAEIAQSGSLQRIKHLPDDIKKIFVTAFDVPAIQHLKIQAAFQRFTDNSVSKTINLAPDATAADVKKIYLSAHELGCKGITIYRYGSKDKQVLSFRHKEKNLIDPVEGVVAVDSEYSGGCVIGACPF